MTCLYSLQQNLQVGMGCNSQLHFESDLIPNSVPKLWSEYQFTEYPYFLSLKLMTLCEHLTIASFFYISKKQCRKDINQWPQTHFLPQSSVIQLKVLSCLKIKFSIEISRDCDALAWPEGLIYCMLLDREHQTLSVQNKFGDAPVTKCYL